MGIASLIFSVIGVILPIILLLLEWHKTRNGRKLKGPWVAACQPLYYEETRWHIQPMTCRWKLLRGLLFDADDVDGKLPWQCMTKVQSSGLISGKWRSKRPGSKSRGYVALEISKNGKYLWGHLYGVPSSNVEALYSVLLLARNNDELEIAHEAMMRGKRELPPLYKTKDFV